MGDLYWVPGSQLVSWVGDCCGHLGSEPADGSVHVLALSLSHSLSLPPSICLSQINNFLKTLWIKECCTGWREGRQPIIKGLLKDSFRYQSQDCNSLTEGAITTRSKCKLCSSVHGISAKSKLHVLRTFQIHIINKLLRLACVFAQLILSNYKKQKGETNSWQ